MKLATFFEKFPLFAEAPNAVPKMRELVLELAVRGRLLPGDPSDLSALSDQSDQSAAPFPIPAHWRWLPFSEVGDQRLGKMLDQKGNCGDLKPYLRNTNVQWMRFQLDDIKELRLAPDELAEYRLKPGDLLICEGGEPGRCAIWQDQEPAMTGLSRCMTGLSRCIIGLLGCIFGEFGGRGRGGA